MSGWSAGYANTFGSYDFIGAQTAIVTLWISMNLAAVAHRWDPYPLSAKPGFRPMRNERAG